MTFKWWWTKMHANEDTKLIDVDESFIWDWSHHLHVDTTEFLKRFVDSLNQLLIRLTWRIEMNSVIRHDHGTNNINSTTLTMIFNRNDNVGKLPWRTQIEMTWDGCAPYVWFRSAKSWKCIVKMIKDTFLLYDWSILDGDESCISISTWPPMSCPRAFRDQLAGPSTALSARWNTSSFSNFSSGVGK